MRVITKPNGHPVALGEYVRSWRALQSMPPRQLVANWTWDSVPAGEILADLSYGVQDRINRHLPWFRRGRKWDEDWQRAMIQSAHALNTPRLRLHWLPPELKARFPHRLAHRDD